MSLPSTRVDALSPRILEEIRRVRKTGFTLAPEAGTQRLRDVIQKEYREEELLDAARLFADLGWRSLKLYFMIGLPSETEDDVRGIAELAGPGEARRAAGGSPSPRASRRSRRSRTRRSSGPRSSTSRRPRRASRCCAASSAAAASSSAGTTASSRGSRACSRAATAASPTSSRRRSAPAPASTAGRTAAASPLWRDALAAARDSTRRSTCGAVRSARLLPWDHLDAGVSTRFLQQDLARAVEGQLTPDCSIERCTYCGACDFRDGAQRRLSPRGRQGHRRIAARRSRAGRSCSSRSTDGEPLPEWETRTWRRIRTEVAARRAARDARRRGRPRVADAAPLPATLAATDDGARQRAARATPRNGSARCRRRWRRRRRRPSPVQRAPRSAIARSAPARFIGTRELGTVFARAARRARLPVAFSRGHHPLPRLVVRPGAFPSARRARTSCSTSI